jgi:uncharacterized protein YndB with AHSA1/START domain
MPPRKELSMKSSIQRDVVIDQPEANVWWALTSRDAIARWAYPNDFEPRLGHRFTLSPPPNPKADFDGTVRCEVLECSPERRLAYSWQGGPVVGTTVTFALEGAGGRTRLHFEHAGFDLSQPWGEGALRGAEAGWTMMLDKIARVAATAPEDGHAGEAE